MGERHSKRERDPLDWYVEEEWNVQALFDRIQFRGHIHDPCCGIGTIVKVTKKNGYVATGSDIVKRARGFKVSDFLTSEERHENIIMNPPYKLAHRMILRALALTQGRVAALMPIKFLAGQGRYKLFTDPRLDRIIIFSRRPNMPPGEELMKHGESIRGGGSIDYCWIVWTQLRYRQLKDPDVEWTL